MATFNTARQQAEVIKNEMADGKNTADRVGSALLELLDATQARTQELEDKIASGGGEIPDLTDVIRRITTLETGKAPLVKIEYNQLDTLNSIAALIEAFGSPVGGIALVTYTGKTLGTLFVSMDLATSGIIQIIDSNLVWRNNQPTGIVVSNITGNNTSVAYRYTRYKPGITASGSWSDWTPDVIDNLNEFSDRPVQSKVLFQIINDLRRQKNSTFIGGVNINKDADTPAHINFNDGEAVIYVEDNIEHHTAEEVRYNGDLTADQIQTHSLKIFSNNDDMEDMPVNTYGTGKKGQVVMADGRGNAYWGTIEVKGGTAELPTITYQELVSDDAPSISDLVAFKAFLGEKDVLLNGSSNAVSIGRVSIFVDNMMHAIHEVFVSNCTVLGSAMASHDAKIHTWHRWFNIANVHGAVGTWSAWEETSAVSEWEDATGLDIETFADTWNRIQVSVRTKTETSPTLAITGAEHYKCTNTLTSLTISSISDNTTESLVMFTTGANVTNFLTLPSGTKIVGEINIEANKSYVMSILRGIVVIGEVTTN